jgi:hypothetical protein
MSMFFYCSFAHFMPYCLHRWERVMALTFYICSYIYCKVIIP